MNKLECEFGNVIIIYVHVTIQVQKIVERTIRHVKVRSEHNTTSFCHLSFLQLTSTNQVNRNDYGKEIRKTKEKAYI